MEKLTSYVYSGDLLLVSDQTFVEIFNSKSGDYFKTLTLSPLYNFSWQDGYRQDVFEKNSGKGQTNFAFSENGIIVFHNQRNFPIAADILLYW